MNSTQHLVCAIEFNTKVLLDGEEVQIDILDTNTNTNTKTERNKNTKVVLDGEEVQIDILDTAGQEDFGRVRPISYNNCNCFLVCFSLMNADSLDNACTKWYREVK